MYAIPMRPLVPLLLLVATACAVPACASPTDDPAAAGDEQNVTGSAVGSKKELFEGEQYYVRVVGWDPSKMSNQSLRDEQRTQGAELAIYKADKTSGLHCPDAETSDGKLVYKTQKFSLRTSGNLTNGTPKSSFKVSLEAKDDRLFDMKALNLKAMWNDVSQMREGLAWRLFQEAGVHAPRHTYAKFCINGRYYGLYSMIEQVEKTFLADHFGANKDGNLFKGFQPASGQDVGPANLTYRRSGADDSGKQYFKNDDMDVRAYQLKTAGDDAARDTYDDLAALIRTVNAVGADGTPANGDKAKLDTAAFQASVEKVFDAKSFLRWAGINSLLGAWDNYWGTGANFYLYNAGPKAAPKKLMSQPYFVWIPWDYDNTFGSDFFNAKWQYASITDWEGATRPYYGGNGTSKLPLITNLLANQTFLRYYLDHLEWANDTLFNERWILAAIGDEQKGLRSRVQSAAYLESDSPNGAPHTGRQFTNDEVFRHGFSHDELNRGGFHVEGILHWVRMRHDSVASQLAQLRTKHPKGSSGASFPARPESIP